MHDYYDSPVRFVTVSTAKIEEVVLGEIAKVSQEYSLDIDREKLIAALKQDQERYMDAYRKGYEDGRRSAEEENKNGHL